MFISPPYIKCPKCGKNAFGVLMITGKSYCRRCKECLYPPGSGPPARFPLPKLNKKIIYIDQNAISNMMKVLNPQVPSHGRTSANRFWFNLFEKLFRLCQLQLIVCPESISHRQESLMSPFFSHLKRMYELLGQEVSFMPYETIKKRQVLEKAENWISGKPNKEIGLDVNSIVYGRINEWKNRIWISLRRGESLEWIKEFRQLREKVFEAMREVFKRWQSETERNFEDWVEEESFAVGKSILINYQEYLQRLKGGIAGKIKRDPLDIIPSEGEMVFPDTMNIFKEQGVKGKDIINKAIEYLYSSSFKDIPYVKITSMLYASIARKAARGGQRRPPNQGMTNDIRTISVLLPYCDAIFIDKGCHTYLRENPLSSSINYGTKLFSLLNKDQFIRYLDEIELDTPKAILKKVEEVYGKDWVQPYTTLYKD